MTDTLDVAAFVTARLDEKASLARDAEGVAAEMDTTREVWLFLLDNRPFDVLREVAAMRAIVASYTAALCAAAHVSVSDYVNTQDEAAVSVLGAAVEHLAAIWSEHADYRPEWKP